MSRQRQLFEDDPRDWVDAVWKSAGGERKREVLALLAEMGRSALAAEVRTAQEDKNDAPR